MFRVPEELSEDPHVRVDAASARSLFQVSAILGTALAVLALLHVSIGPEPTGLPLMPVEALSAALVLAVAWRWWRRTDIRHAANYMAFVFLVLTLDVGVHLWVTGQDWQATNFILVLIGIGMAVLKGRWYLALTVLAWSLFVAGFARIPNVDWDHWVISMGLATLVGALIRSVRRRSLDQAVEAVAQQRSVAEQAMILAWDRQRLLATVSHDVRTPVAGIVSIVDLLLDRPLDARTRELVEGVRNSALGLTTMLDNLLDQARIEQGRLDVDLEPTDLEEVISEVMQMVTPLAQGAKLPLIPAISADCPTRLRTDSHRLQQVLLNLVSNAVKFTDHGAVTIIARGQRRNGQPWIEIAVRDSGPGMTAEEIETVFEEFVQGGQTPGKPYPGAGMGLTIANRLTQALGGELQVTSTPGGGSTFGVWLPVGDVPAPIAEPRHSPGDVVVSGHPLAVEAITAQMQRFGRRAIAACEGRPGTVHLRVVSSTEEGEATRPRDDDHRLVVLGPAPALAIEPTAAEYLQLPWTSQQVLQMLDLDTPGTETEPKAELPSGIRILLAEDDPSNRSVLAEMLRRMGALVTLAGDGAAAVEEVARDTYDVLLLDLNMPVMDGLSAVRVIRQRLAGPEELVVLALTADTGWTDRRVLETAGFSGYVAKPTTRAGLHASIVGALQRVPQPAESTDSSGLCQDTLQELADSIGGHSVVAEAIGIYLEELPGRLVTLLRAQERGADEEVRFTAHALKSASGMLGAIHLQHLCQQMEADPGNAGLLAEVAAEAEVVETQMREHVRSVSLPAGTAQPL